MVNQTRLVDLFCELVKIDSPSRGERVLADRLKSILESLGFQVAEDRACDMIGGNCGNLYAHLPGSLPFAPILFSCHMDTVEPCRGKRAIIGPDGVIRSGGDTILGADNLAGIAAVIEAVRCVLETARPHRPLEILLSVAEESHLAGVHCFEPERLSAREAYVLDTSGSPGLAVLQAPGHIALVFDIHGQAAHAGINPEAGISAIQSAALGISRLRTGRVNEGSTVNVGRIEGGGETNIVADYCRVTAECRSLDMDMLQIIAGQIKDNMANAAYETGATIQISEKASYLPYRIDPERPVVRRFKDVCREIGLPICLTSTGGGSDNNVLALNGIDGIVLACGMNKVHSREENISICDLADTARLARGLIETI